MSTGPGTRSGQEWKRVEAPRSFQKYPCHQAPYQSTGLFDKPFHSASPEIE